MRPDVRIPLAMLGVLVGLSAAGSTAAAQRMITAGIAAGVAPERGRANHPWHGLNGLAYVEAAPPFLPVSVRTDAMAITGQASGTLVVASANVVYTVVLPGLRPYVMTGYGHYGAGRADLTSGWNAGAGLRVQGKPLRLFAEGRRHWPLRRDIFAVGVSL